MEAAKRNHFDMPSLGAEDLFQVWSVMQVIPTELQSMSISQMRSRIHSSTNPLYALELEESCTDAKKFVLNHPAYFGALNASLRRSDYRSLRYIKRERSILKWKVSGEVHLCILVHVCMV